MPLQPVRSRPLPVLSNMRVMRSLMVLMMVVVLLSVMLVLMLLLLPLVLSLGSDGLLREGDGRNG